MNQIWTQYGGSVIIGLIGFAALMAIKPTRSVIQYIFGSNGPALGILAFMWLILGMVFKAHLVVLKNFAPRRVILPTLEKKGTRIH